MITLINNDFREVLPKMNKVRMVFADPPDNLDLDYDGYDDHLSERAYYGLLQNIVFLGTDTAEVVWISYNAIHTYLMANIIYWFLENRPDWEAKPCAQTFTFGQHNQYDFGSGHRPLARLTHKGTSLYPDAVRVPSWRQLHGDKRADPRGRVPNDIFDFPRVTGNSKQRRKYHPTQLNEGLYERCIRLCCKPTDMVCDIFAGTGTLARVCQRTGNPCTLVEISSTYCEKIAAEHELTKIGDKIWRSE